MSKSPTSILHSPTVIIIAKGAVLIGALSVIFWGIRSCIAVPVEKPMEVAEKLIAAGKEVGLTIINKGFSSDSGSISLIVQKDKKVANLVTVERPFEYESKYSTTWWWSKKTLILKAVYKAHGGIDMDTPEELQITIPTNGKGPITCDGLKGKLVSCEMIPGTLRVVRDDAGIWNRLTPEDTAIAVNQLNENARKHILESDLERQAEENFLRRLREKAENATPYAGRDGIF